MRTKRKFAHELYPHPDEGEVQPLHQAVPYLYAIAAGLETHDTDWYDLWRPAREDRSEAADYARRLTVARTMELIDARRIAFMADAMLQGLTGPEAWEWAESRNHPEAGELIYDRATHYGVPVDQIKPYPVVAEVGHHCHYGEPDPRGWRTATRVDGKESECVECCDPDPVVAVDLFGEAREEPEVKS